MGIAMPVPDLCSSPSAHVEVAARSGSLLDAIPTGARLGKVELAEIARQFESPELFPEVVSLRGDHGLCTGVMVTERVLLTAAHCLPARQVTAAGRTAGVTAAARHPELDAALLLLDAPMPAPTRPWRCDVAEQAPMGDVLAVGFGAADFAGAADGGVGRAVRLPVSGWGCDGERVSHLGCLPGRELVQIGAINADTCAGDSGGPLYEAVGGDLRLVAITSRPIRRSGRSCGDGGLYTRVDVLVPWVLDQSRTWSLL